MGDYVAFHTRARELMLNPEDRAAYLRLMLQGERGDFTVQCPDCSARMQTYESDVLKHVRTCVALRATQTKLIG